MRTWLLSRLHEVPSGVDNPLAIQYLILNIIKAISLRQLAMKMLSGRVMHVSIETLHAFKDLMYNHLNFREIACLTG